MNPTPPPAAGTDVGSWPVSPSLLAVLVLGGVVLMVAFVYCLVVLLAVLMRTSDRRADARRVLREVGRTLERLVERLIDLFRGRRRPDDQAGNHDRPDSPDLST